MSSLNKKPFYKNWIFWVLIVVFFGLMAFSGKTGLNYLNKKEKQYNETIKELKQSVLILETQVSDAENEIYNLNENEKRIKYQFIQERAKRIQAENNIINIDTLVFSRKYLDSIAKYIKFR